MVVLYLTLFYFSEYIIILFLTSFFHLTKLQSSCTDKKQSDAIWQYNSPLAVHTNHPG